MGILSVHDGGNATSVVKREACGDIVSTCWRQCHLSSQKRKPNVYNKTNDEYWGPSGEIFSKRRKVEIPCTSTKAIKKIIVSGHIKILN